MSDDAETARQIRALSLDTRPLLVLDVDEVVLEFVRPFTAFLDSQGYTFAASSFRLHGNVIAKRGGAPAANETVSALLEAFFAAQEDWQTPAEGAVAAIEAMGRDVEVVLLTAMPHLHHGRRRALLDRLGISAPLVTTEAAKGPAVTMLKGARSAPVAFVDDLPHNLVSVARAEAGTHLFHLMANEAMRAFLPPLPDGVTALDDWTAAEERIGVALGL